MLLVLYDLNKVKALAIKNSWTPLVPKLSKTDKKNEALLPFLVAQYD
jgi:hypothetical protein